MSLNTTINHSILSLSCNSLDPIEHVDTINSLATMCTAFSKCKSYIENGQRLENMSWRLWQFNHSRKSTNNIDNSTIKRLITAVLLSPADVVHDAYSHEVPQQIKKCYPSSKEESSNLEQRPISNTEISRTSSFCVVPSTSPQISNESIVEKKIVVSQPQEQQKQQQQQQQVTKQFVVVTDDDDDEDEDDYYLSDEDDYEEEEEDINYHFVNDFKKTQPRPTTPRRSLLSDLFGRVSSPPSLLSNSTSSFTSTTTSIILDDDTSSTHQFQKHSSHIALNTKPQLTADINDNKKPTANDPSEIRWRESFHGW